MGGSISLVPSLPSRNKTLVPAVKNEAKTDIKAFSSCPMFLISGHCFIDFGHDCLCRKKITTCTNLLQTSISFSLLNLQSLSQGFHANIMWVYCAKARQQVLWEIFQLELVLFFGYIFPFKQEICKEERKSFRQSWR